MYLLGVLPFVHYFAIESFYTYITHMTKKSTLITLIITILALTPFLAHANTATQQTVVNNGIGLGTAIAVAISWSENKSIMWAIIHGIFSWLYVIYYALNR